MKILSNFANFWNLSWIDKRLVIKTLFLMIFVRLMLWSVPFKYIQKFIQKTTKNAITKNNAKNNLITVDKSVDKVIWAVKAASQYVPRATCLTTALTAHILLSNQNYPTQVKIGVGRDEEGQFEAHAWLEHDDIVVMGESEKDYIPLAELGNNK